MSWDVLIMDLPADATSVSDLPDDFVPPSLGPRSELIRRITEVAPSVDVSDPSWGFLTTPEFSIEFNIGSDDPVDSVMLHVRGNDSAVAFIAELLHHLAVRAIDFSSGEFFEPTASQESFSAWRRFRDRVIDGP